MIKTLLPRSARLQALRASGVKSVLSACIVLVCVATSAHARTQKTLIVSDIDDTIQLTQMKAADGRTKSKARHALNFSTGLLKSYDAFTAMPSLYSFLASNQNEIHYVTGAPKIVSMIPERFLQTANFPVGALWLRPDTEITTEEYKVERISEILLANRDARVILIGDNGERDVRVYERLSQDPRFQKQIADVYIHRLYTDDIGLPLAAGQKSYLTTADLALQLHLSGDIDLVQMQIVFRQVESALQSRFSEMRDLAFPNFAPVLEVDLARFEQSLSRVDDSSTQASFHKILELLRNRPSSAAKSAAQR
ncbi:MAG: App1 family protein [Bdellovibrionaceae bacterium]|nr:App1 family protein [Pseudobdellovibrionaceae bacterium]